MNTVLKRNIITLIVSLLMCLVISVSASAQTFCPSVYPCDADYNLQQEYFKSDCFDQYQAVCQQAKIQALSESLKFCQFDSGSFRTDVTAEMVDQQSVIDQLKKKNRKLKKRVKKLKR